MHKRFRYFVMHSWGLGDRYSIVDTSKIGQKSFVKQVKTKKEAQKLVDKLNKKSD